jgi:hypothetical protein
VYFREIEYAGDTVKALPKKRSHQMTLNPVSNMPETNMLKYQALWYSAFTALYIWFLYYLCRDFFILQKPIIEVNIINYIGSIVSLASLWAGTKILKRPKVDSRITQFEAPKVSQNSDCNHTLGYLHQRPKSQPIPGECLTCEKLIQCFSSSKRYTNSPFTFKLLITAILSRTEWFFYFPYCLP